MIEISFLENSIQVQDSGMGMDSYQIERLFSTKISTEGTQGEKGSGIGLMLTKDFADSIKVTISVKSVQGEGTQFQLQFA